MCILDKPQNWSKILQNLFLPPNLDLYQHYYQPLINDRIKIIISSTWELTVANTNCELQKLLNNVTGTDHKTPISIWIQETADIPLSLKQALSSDKTHHHLLMKSKGFTTNILNICQTLDTNLKTLFEDLTLFVNGTGIESKRHEVFGSAEQDEIVTFLRSASQQGVSQ